MTDSREPPRVSIVIPCYKGARFLPAAIESCLRQQMGNFELIVVDDASPDQSVEIAEKYAQLDPRVIVVRREVNGGVSEAFNTGFNIAKGRFFTRLAQDDLFAEDALAIMSEHLQRRPRTGLAYCDYFSIDENGTATGRIQVAQPDAALLLANRVGLCVMWRREVWDQIGGFDSQFDAAEDYEYWLRILKSFPIEKLDGPAPLFVRRHPQMGTRQFFQRQEHATLRLLREHFPTMSSSIKRTLLQHKAIGRALFLFAGEYSAEGRLGVAFSNVFRSFLNWPVPFRRSEVFTSLARPRMLASLLMRLVGVKR